MSDTDLDDLIAQIDKEAFGSMYSPQVSQSAPPPQSSIDKSRSDRANSITGILAQLDLETMDDIHEHTHGKDVSSLMDYPVEVSDWKDKARRSGQVPSSHVATGINSRGSPVVATGINNSRSYDNNNNNYNNNNNNTTRTRTPTNNYSSSFNNTTRTNSRPVSVQPSFGSANSTSINTLPIQQAEISVAVYNEPEEYQVEETLPDFNLNFDDNNISLHSNHNHNQHSTYTAPSNNYQHTAPPAVTSHSDYGNPNKICSKCHQPLGIEQRILIPAQDRLYHLRCWSCNKCGIELRSSKYYIKEDSPFCETCFSNVLCEICKKCGALINGAMIEAMGANWHQNCFVCNQCGRSFENGFFVRNEVPLCEHCIHTPQSSAVARGRANCSACGNLVMSEGSFTALGKTWHKRCFKCGVCSTELWNQSFFTREDGRPYCRNHGV